MNVLDYLSQKRNGTTAYDTHPLAHKSDTFKASYCFGLAILVYGYKDQLPITLECFSSILDNIRIDSEHRTKLPLQVKKNFELKTSELFQSLDEKNIQYCFIADLYRLSFFGLISPTYTRDIIEGFHQVFNFDNHEKGFLKDFCELGYQTKQQALRNTLSYYDTKLETAKRLYQTFTKTGHHVSTAILEYIYPEFSISNEIEHLTLDDGSIARYESNLQIVGNLNISNCSTVVIDHAKVHIRGKIHVNNGKIIIRNSQIHVDHCSPDYLISIENAPAIRIENSVIDCNQQCGFLSQASGQLSVCNSEIRNTAHGYAIQFQGNNAEITTTKFEHCEHGALFNNSTRELFLASCKFKYCSNVHGGAIHSHAMSDTTIYNCTFSHCQAKALGAAVYFTNLKYGQSVLSCSFQHCQPKDSILFNSYDNKYLDTGLASSTEL